MSKLRVLFDAFELVPDSGKSIGIYHYAVSLWRALQSRADVELEWVLACNGRNADALAGALGSRQIVYPGAPSQWQRQAWLRWHAQALMRREGCDVYFSPKGFLPGWWGRTFGVRTCAVVHDLIPLWYAEHHPGYFGRAEAWVVNRELQRTCRSADAVVTISEAAAQDIRQRCPGGSPPHVIHNGLPPVAVRPVPSGRVRPFIFAMASSLPHKNARMVLAGYQRYRACVDDPLDLVVCGIDDPGQPGVTTIRGVSAEVLHGHYREARLFVFLSRTEGFGFPPLEAMAHGTPVLCSDIPVLRETTCGNAVFVAPDDASAIGAALRETLSPEGHDTLMRLRGAAPGVLARYSWSACAESVAGVLKSLA